MLFLLFHQLKQMKIFFSIFYIFIFSYSGSTQVSEERGEEGLFLNPEKMDSFFISGNVGFVLDEVTKALEVNNESSVQKAYAYYFLARYKSSQNDIIGAMAALDSSEHCFIGIRDTCNYWYYKGLAEKARIQTSIGTVDYISPLIKKCNEVNNHCCDSTILKGLTFDLSLVLMKEGDFKGSKELLDSLTFSILESDILKFRLLIFDGHQNYYQGFYDEAIKKYTAACNLLESKGYDFYLIRSLGYLSQAYLHIGNYDLAMQYDDKREKLFLGRYEELKVQYLDLLNSQGNILRKLGRFSEAIDKYKEGLAKIKLEKDVQSDISRAKFYTNLSIAYTDNKDLENASFWSEESIRLHEKHLDSPYSDKKAYFNEISNQGTIEYYRGNYYSAAQFYREASDRISSTFNSRHESLIETLNNQAISLENANKIEEALKIYPKLYHVFGFDPNAKFPFLRLTHPEYLNYSLWNHAEALRKLYYDTGNESYLDEAFFYFQHLLDLLDILRLKYIGDARKLVLFDENKITYDRTIELGMQKWEKEGDQYAKDITFNVNERIKGLLLLEIISSEKVLNSNENNVGLSSLFDLHRQIQSLQKQLYNSENKDIEKELLNRYSELISLLNYRNDEDNLASNLIFNIDISTVSDVQNNLKKNETLIEYFTGDKNIYIFVVKSDTFHVEKIKKDFDLEKWVSNVQFSILSQSTKSNNRDSLNQILLDNSKNIYNKVVSSVSGLLTDKLIIVPDGVLGYLPFDILVTNNANDIKEAEYLIKNHEISYQYSATLWLEMVNKKVSPKKQVLAFAPEFPTRPVDTTFADLYTMRSNLWRLSYSKEEVDAINNNWTVNSAFGEDATVQNFIRDASDYRVVHLSTHGKADDRVGDFCYLAFTKTSDTLDRRLYVRDLYNMKLNADMVVLSACETGLGELQQGEGILSLARGFAYAGAKSIVSTLWSVDDKSTSDIMAFFYAHLKDGKTKDTALRQAKLNYLDNNPNAHPFFWAAFIAVGDMSPIESDRIHWMYYGLIGMWVLAIIYLVIKRKKSD